MGTPRRSSCRGGRRRLSPLDQRGEASGLLRVNTTYAFGQGLIAPMLPEFLMRYPQVQVQLDRPSAYRRFYAARRRVDPGHPTTAYPDQSIRFTRAILLVVNGLKAMATGARNP